MRHHIQKQILDTLSQAESLRYADINPMKLEGNVFTYHVKQLIIDDLITQNEDKSYSLTTAGRAYIVHRNEKAETSAHSIFLVVIRHKNKLLLRKRLVQPMLGYSGFVHGEPHAELSIEESVINRVKEKTGMGVNDIRIHGSGLIRMKVDGETNNFSHAILVSASAINKENFIKNDKTGENFWVEKNQLATTEQLLPSCSDLMELIHSLKSVWYDLSYDF